VSTRFTDQECDVRTKQEGVCAVEPRTRNSRLSDSQLHRLDDILRQQSARFEARGKSWGIKQISNVIRHEFGVCYHPNHIYRLLARVRDVRERNEGTVYFKTSRVTLYYGDGVNVLDLLPDASVDCIVTSPPYYGQRD
jgi:hypothetical protein